MPKHRAKKQVTVEGVTLTEVAQTFGKSRETIKAQLVSLKPLGKRGTENIYSLPAVQAVMSKIRSKGDGPASKDKEELEKRKLELQCDKLQIEIDQRLGKLIPVEEVRRHFATHTAAVRAHLLKLPAELCPLLEGLTIGAMEKKAKRYNLEVMKRLQEMEFE